MEQARCSIHASPALGMCASPCSNYPVTTITSEPDRTRRHGVLRLPERERTAHDHSRSDHRKPRHHRHLEPAAPLKPLSAWRVMMKPSSARRARRWVIQELTSRLMLEAHNSIVCQADHTPHCEERCDSI